MRHWIAFLAAIAAAAQMRLPVRGIPTASTVAAASPFPGDCDGSQAGRHFRDAAVETWVAADPNNPLRLAGVWQQDRWSNGGASGLLAAMSIDGGRTWQQSAPPFSACGGGDGRYRRASDPWVTIGADGTVYSISLSLTASNAGQAMLVSRSADGRNWGGPIAIVQEQNADVLNDKESITADPGNPSYVYAVWDRLSGMTSSNRNNFRGPAYFARTIDGGETWEPARSIFDPGGNSQTIGNQIVVLPEGMLIDIFCLVQNATAPMVRDERLSIAVIRSADQGATWSPPIVVANPQPVGVSDVKNGIPIRSAALLPFIGVDRATGALYVVWQDGRFSAGQREGIAMSRSEDGGLTWTEPAQINQVPEVQAFTPAIAVSPKGQVAVTYYDFRKDNDDRGVLLTSYWRILSADGGRTWSEEPLAEPFDLAAAAVVEGGGYFIGDYQGLAAAGDRFLAFFVVAGGGPFRSQVLATTRPTGGDRVHNGHTEVNRYRLRRRIEKEGRRK